MRKNIFLASCVFFLFNGDCLSQQATIFSGNVSGLDMGSKIYLIQRSADGIVDSLTVTSDSFEFKLNVEQFDLYFFKYSIKSKTSDYPVFLQKGSNVSINIGGKKEPVTFIGSALADEQNDYYKGIYATGEKLTSLNQELSKANDPALIEKINIERKKLIKKEEDYSIRWVKSHQNSPFSVAILAYYLDNTPAETLIALYQNLSVEATENNLVNQALAGTFATKSINEQFKIGGHIEDFILKDTSYNPHSFYELKQDNYVLVDFWASWCGPCRRNNPEIIKLLNTYKKSNFQVISISADTDSAQWKKAIVDDKMYWPNLSDLKGTDSGFIKEHHVFAFPTYIVIAPNGEIVSIPNNIAGVKEFFDKNLKGLK